VTLVADELPDLEGLLREAGRADLADQLTGLQIRQRCECSVEGCRSFYTALPMKRWFRRGKQVPVGDYVVDTIDGQIVYVEVLRLDRAGES
jgi:hypothetical protein